MADDLKAALLQGGHRVREYCTIGELLPGMAYLVRRLLENTSNEGFLRMKNTGEASLEELLRNPTEMIASAPEPMARKPRRAPLSTPRTSTSRSPQTAKGSARPLRRSSPAAWAGNTPS